MFIHNLKQSAAASVLMACAFAGPVHGEDAIPFDAVDCGGGCATPSPVTHFLRDAAGASFVINIAYLAPPPEEAFIDQTPVVCETINFRVDTLAIAAAKGEIAVTLGDGQRLTPGNSIQLVQRARAKQNEKGLVTSEMDMMGFRVRSEAPSSRCSLVASGLYYANDNASPIPFAVLPGSSLTRN
jgi:hypothetical protein